MKYLLDQRYQIVGGFIFLVLATVDLMIQEKNYHFDVQSLRYLSPFGMVCFILFAGCFAMFIGGLLVALYKQLFRK